VFELVYFENLIFKVLIPFALKFALVGLDGRANLGAKDKFALKFCPVGSKFRKVAFFWGKFARFWTLRNALWWNGLSVSFRQFSFWQKCVTTFIFSQ